MENPVILCLSDLHIADYEDDHFKDICNEFSKKLGAFFSENIEWRPDFLCITGDLVNRGNSKESFSKAKNFIDKICEDFGISKNHVLMVPGNHDMDMTINGMKVCNNSDHEWTKYEEAALSYKVLVDSFLETPDENNYEKIKPYFQNYIDFRNKYEEKESDVNYPESLKFLKPLVQYKVFEEERIIFWELNNTWYSIPEAKQMKNNVPSRDEMKFGAAIINEFQGRIKELKSEGYIVVTLFHHSIRMVAAAEYQTYNNLPCPFDKIVELSDICMAGHEHGSESKDPIFLANSCQYFYNGAFYSEKSTNNDIRDSSCLLIKINKLDNELTRRKIIYTKGREFKIEPSGENNDSEPIFRIFPYYQASGKIDTKKIDIDFRHRQLPYKHKSYNSDSLHGKIVSSIFGKKFHFDKENNALKKDNVEYALLYFVEIEEPASMSKIHLDGKTNKVIVCYLAPKGMPRENAENKVKKMNDPYKERIMEGLLITFLVFLW